MALEDDDRCDGDLRDSPPPLSRSSCRTPDNDDLPPDGSFVREDGDRHREVRSVYRCTIPTALMSLLNVSKFYVRAGFSQRMQPRKACDAGVFPTRSVLAFLKSLSILALWSFILRIASCDDGPSLTVTALMICF